MPEQERLALALLLAVAARSLVFVFVVSVAVRLFPVQPLDPAWQMNVCSVLLNQAALPLLALVLLHAASALHPADGRLASARKRWRGLAVAATLGFALLLPLQGFATWRGLSQAIQQDSARGADAERRSGAMLQAIQAASSVDDLQARMQRLRGPTLTPADRNLPLPQLRRQLEANLLAARRQLLDRVSGPSPNQVWMILSDGVRLAVSSLAFALAFAAGAQRRLSPEPLLLEWSRAIGRWKRLLPLKLGRRQKHSTNDPGRYLREIESRNR
ncbi:hypothetical protein KBZ12_16815 [Cyanobium sp. Cruz CV13-4-11]|uniref:hypothetical protein n=1 Tax=unclassified Cyanobium TaxID=2627006 RepID=UPI0020CD24A7|nr:MULTISPECIES: hypothetical protein [unclassified Cyanobium]MCP9902223.1 hypothetical protein [Cyanobium sp. Cruz CV11-17]MCP9921112.1 hypothetical protein [Cyanobium sp. Cruz CV13-4-11]